jgi:putative spermidine/putrescine transport system substrate-binding protein
MEPTMNRKLHVVLLLAVALCAIPCAVLAAKPYEGKVLRISTFGGQWQASTQQLKGRVIEEMTGAKVEYVVGNPKENIPTAIAALRRGAPPPFDVIELAEDGSQFLAVQSGVLQKLDYSKLPNAANVRPIYKHDALVAFFRVNLGIIYNRDKFKAAGVPPPQRFEDLLDSRVVGHVSLPNSNVTMWPYMLVGFALDGGGSEKNLDPAFKQLAKANVLDYYRASAEANSRVASGEIWASVYTNGLTFRLMNDGVPVSFVDPLLGPHGEWKGFEYTDLAGVMKNTTVPELAYMYINLSLDPRIQYEHAKIVGYGPTNTLIEDTFLKDPVLKDRYLHDEKDIAKEYRMDWSIVEKSMPAWTDRWNREIVRK